MPSWRNLTWAVGRVSTIILQVYLLPQRGGEGGRRLLLELLLGLANQECHRKRQKQLAKPLSAHQHHEHGKTARHSSQSRSVSRLSLCLSGSSATSVLLIVTHLAARHDSAVWRRSKVEVESKSSLCKVSRNHSRNVIRAASFL